MAPTTSPQKDIRFGAKLAILCCTVALLTACLISSFYISRTNDITIENGTNNLAWQTRLLAPSFKQSFLRMGNDAFLLSHSPGIRDYARFEQNKEKATAAKRTPQQLHFIVATYFETLIKLRPQYTQLRLIGVRNHGKELVRVNKTKDGSVLVDINDLQEKENEPYFQDSLSLKAGQSYFSIVSLNREHGKVVEPKEITIRHVVPVMNGDNKLFGFVVINADYESLLQASLDTIDFQGSILAINDAGDYTRSDQNKKFAAMQFHEDPDYIQTPLAEKIHSLSTEKEAKFEQTVDGIQQIVYYTKIPFDSFSNNADGRYLGIALLEPKSDFVEPQKQIMKQSFIWAFLMICLAPLLAYPLAKAMNQHFEDLRTKLTTSEASEKKALMKLKAIIENAVDGLITISKQGIILSINPACEKMFGYHSEEMLGQNIKMLMPDKYSRNHDQYLENYQQTHDAKIIGIGREVEGRRKNGQIFALDLSVSEVNTGDTSFYSGIVRDISERKKAENLLKTTNESLIKSNAELDDFAYIASHDLKEPLRAIYNHSRFMMEDFEDELPEGAKTRLKRLLEVSVRMDKLIDDLLNFSRISRANLSMEEIDMNIVAQDAIKNIDPYLEQQNGKAFIEGTLPPVMGDKVRLVSIIQNLMVNGLKYNDHDEKIIRIGYREKHTYNGKEETGVYFVQDNGIGIDAKFKDSVFRIFKRLHSPKIYGDGTGSGLTFTKKNVERHGGTIWFESIPGEGTIFYFTLKEKDHV